MRISVSKFLSLIDDTIFIKCSHCSPGQPVTLHLRAPLPSDSLRGHFSSVGHFTANAEGSVNVGSSCSLGGSYEGIDAMGLFWSLQPESNQRKGLRFLQRIVDGPISFQLRAMPGHRPLQEAVNLTTSKEPGLTFKRTYLSDDVIRKPLPLVGRVRGTEFAPKRPGRYPCLLDMFGMGGGVMEHRAALLASKGFRVLALAIFNFQDLPQQMEEVDMDYFSEAADLMLQKSPDSKLGIIGSSLGANVAIELAAMRRSEVTACVCINGMQCRALYPVKRNQQLLPNAEFDFSLREPSINSSFSLIKCFDAKADERHLLPVEQVDANLLLINSGGDMGTPSYSGARIDDRMRQFGKGGNCEMMLLPGAGHLLEPPFSPLNRVVYNSGYCWDYGGEVGQHAAGQSISWKRIVQFFKQQLLCDTDNPIASL